MINVAGHFIRFATITGFKAVAQAAERSLPGGRWRERDHGVHQVVHLTVRERLAIAGLELLHVVFVALLPEIIRAWPLWFESLRER